jgi:hypothetical protein
MFLPLCVTLLAYKQMFQLTIAYWEIQVSYHAPCVEKSNYFALLRTAVDDIILVSHATTLLAYTT